MSDHCVLQFDCEFLNIDWDTFLDYAHSSIDEMWDKFKVLTMEGINKFIPKAGQHRPNAKKIFSLSLKTFNSSYIKNTSYGNAGLLARMKQYTGNTKSFE